MNRKRLKWYVWPVVVLCASSPPYLLRAGAKMAQDPATPEKAAASWQSPAKLHHMMGKEKGDLSIGGNGIEFRPLKGGTIRLPSLEVQTFFVSPHSLAIESYQNRKRHLPGMARYKFDLDQAIPAQVAAELAREVQRPSQNAVPDPASESTALPAHHRNATGGTNGMLRFREGGIDYVTTVAGDSRSWRWADLQTLSGPDPYHLLAFGYRDTYTFDLKEPLPQSVYHRLTDALDAQSAADSGERLAVQTPRSPTGQRQGAADE